MFIKLLKESVELLDKRPAEDSRTQSKKGARQTEFKTQATKMCAFDRSDSNSDGRS